MNILRTLSLTLILAAVSASALAAKEEEKIDCMIGTEDLQARIAVHAINGVVQSFAYYSKWKPYTCSVDAEREDGRSEWKDFSDGTKIVIEKGSLLVNATKDEYRFNFQNVEREKYCGMSGHLNGTIVIKRNLPYGTPDCGSIEGALMDRETE
ncbi:MAG: hypothetical protein WC635_02510 [Bacteriovorax sp.]|jgi:hypothetical protein